MNKQYAIFDMDGTLVDSMPYWQRLGREYLMRAGVTEVSTELLERIKPMTMAESTALFHKELGLAGSPEQIADELHAIMRGHYLHDIQLKPGAAEYLQALKGRGVRMCVASATVERLVEACLSRLGVMDCFAFLLSCDTVGAGKDRPDVFLAAAERFGAKPEEIASYEDSIFAVETAAKAGFYTVGVYDHNGADSWEALQTIADETITDWFHAAAELSDEK